MEKMVFPDKNINRVIFLLSIAGIVMAIYVLQSFLRQSSIICLTGSGCEMVRKSPIAWPLGIPVPAIGLAGYTFMAILAFIRTTSNDKRLLNGIFGMAIFGICFVTWFTSMELFVIHGICMWCAISAVNMYIVFFLTLKSLSLVKNEKSSN
jgi:uncharacterized membrane protein